MTIATYLESRWVERGLHQVWIDEAAECATFPLWTITGQLAGFHQHRPYAPTKSVRYFTFKNKGVVAVWGLESLVYDGPVAVVEGVFDAARLTWNGRPAVAVLSNDPSGDVSNWLKSIGRTTIAIPDPDAAGQRLIKHCDLAYTHLTSDVGDALDQEFEDLLDFLGNV